MIARHHASNQWLAALEDLKVKDLRKLLFPGPHTNMGRAVCLSVLEPLEGRKALKVAGLGSFNGWQGEFSMANPQPLGPEPEPPQPDRACTARPKPFKPVRAMLGEQTELSYVIERTITGDQE